MLEIGKTYPTLNGDLLVTIAAAMTNPTRFIGVCVRQSDKVTFSRVYTPEGIEYSRTDGSGAPFDGKHLTNLAIVTSRYLTLGTNSPSMNYSDTPHYDGSNPRVRFDYTGGKLTHVEIINPGADGTDWSKPSV